MLTRTRTCLIVAATAFLIGAASPGLAATGGSDFYEITIEDAPAGVGMGVYTFTTGLMHPVTIAHGRQNILVGTGNPGTSFTTIRSYSSGTDYVQRNGLTLAAGAPLTLSLDGFVAAGEEAIPIGDPLNPAGFSTIYRPGGFAAAPDDLVITHSVEAVGATFDDSAVRVTTEITNNGGAPALIGVRYLWDTQIGANDDGPSFKPMDPDAPALGTDTDFFDPSIAAFEVTDNNESNQCFGIANSPSPFYSVQGSVMGPASLAPTPPTRVSYVSWPDASGLPGKFGGVTPALNGFDYVSRGMDVSTCLTTIDDSGVASWWGDAAGNALMIDPGATVSVEAFVFGYLPGAPPAFTPAGVEGPWDDGSCSDGEDNDGDSLVDLDDPDCEPPAVTVEGPWEDPSCSDQIDNDDDGLVDLDDPDCAPPPSPVEGPWDDPSCSDQIDNDDDGLTDADDPECAPPPPGVEGPHGHPSCDDMIDNDGDGLIDQEDPDCAPTPAPVEGPVDHPSCSDGIDNDHDGLTDGDDPGCRAPNSSPGCEGATAGTRQLWPPNHRLATVGIEGVTDADGDPLAITITSIMQDEPVTEIGDGNSCPDADGLGGETAELRAERSGLGDGRVYHIAFTADDGEGGSCSGEVTVCVPHSRRSGRRCVDQGALFSATGPCGRGNDHGGRDRR
jgi:hypothetical protein